jgi:asparagine synthase (glutamine-hydrolysing)
MSAEPTKSSVYAVPNPLNLDPYELATGLALGTNAAIVPLPEPGAASAREVLEAELVPALSRPPCVMSFSGGRDSSAMLALATSVARREGLPDPIPLTWRFPAHPAMNESQWQEQVISRLGLREWEILKFDEELEVLGEMATGVLRQHGLLWPATAHLSLPALTHARGGSLLVTAHLRRLLDGWQFARASQVVRGRVKPEWRDAGRLAVALMPQVARRRVGRAETVAGFSWLTPQAQHVLFARLGGRFNMPRRWDRWLAWVASKRSVALAEQSQAVLAREYDVVPHYPVGSPAFLAALAREGGSTGFSGRPELTNRLFGNLVPDDVLARPQTRYEFADVLWASHSRAFAHSWDGSGVDHELVDTEHLRAMWTGPRPWLYGWSATVAQAAWLGNARS